MVLVPIMTTLDAKTRFLPATSIVMAAGVAARRSSARTDHSEPAPGPPLDRGNHVPVPLIADANFWTSGPGLADLSLHPLASETPDLLLRELGPAPVETGDTNVAALLAAVFATIAQAAERRALR